MANQPQIFDLSSIPDTEDNIILKEDFLDFFPEHHLMPIFTEEHEVPTPIKVHWSMAKGVVQGTGAGNYQQTLQTFSETLRLNMGSRQYNSALRQIMLQAKGQFQIFMKKIKEVQDVILNAPPNYETRLWQAAYYSDEALNMPSDQLRQQQSEY